MQVASAQRCLRLPAAAPGRASPLRSISWPRPGESSISRSASYICRASLSDDELPLQFDMLASLLSPDAVVSAGSTPLGRGLITSQPVKRGQALLQVDWCNLLCITDEPARTGSTFGAGVLADWQLIHGQLPPLLETYLLSDSDWFLRLMCWLLWLKQHSTGLWPLYIDSLPKESDMCCLMNYLPEEASEFQSSVLEAKASSERAAILALHDNIFSATTGDLNVLGLSLQPEDTLWAACMVNSRCFSDQVGRERVSMMVPCADMANHMPQPNTGFVLDAKTSTFQLEAVQDMPAGIEACISYLGPTPSKSNEQMLKDYGFILPGNPNDRIPFDAGDDMQSRMQEGYQPLSLDAAILAEAVNILSDTESTRAEAGRQQAVLSSLNPFLKTRPVAGSSSQNEDLLEEGRRSVAALISQCDDLLAAHGTTISTDEALLSGAEGELPVRRAQAVVTRLERKYLITAAKNVLQQYEKLVAFSSDLDC